MCDVFHDTGMHLLCQVNNIHIDDFQGRCWVGQNGELFIDCELFSQAKITASGLVFESQTYAQIMYMRSHEFGLEYEPSNT